MPIVTVSRGTMSGGRAVAEAVASSLGCPCIGREIFTDAAVQLGVSPELLETRLERVPGVWERVTAERRRYLVALKSALAEHVARGDFVYHSYAGHLLLRGLPGVLRVRITAPLGVRVREVMEEEGSDYDAAEAIVRRSDEARARWTRIMYGVDWTDSSLYDLVINLEQISAGDASTCVLQAARLPKYTASATTRETYEDFALASKVEAALERNPATRGLSVRVSGKAGFVTIEGLAPEVALPSGLTDVFRRELTSVVAAVEGVRGVRLDLRTVMVPSLT
jgi:cytidylate kinase